ncbi:MAG TPA: Asp-tRNA(Asn)/Glu-tRNA(Gln) amidotransferase subunit GatC [Candidatus Saccharimonadales bacterium]|nr:Asp-tRNA(Asn)/Glu-tRNA(Gln) amidotransferase subunit GatC [Candidatus Saccharimonadales bacterium]
MTELTREDVLKLARLARLDLTDEEVEAYRKQLSDVLQYVAQLDQVDTAGLEPTTQVTGLKNVMREDQVIDYGVSPEDLLRLAPQSQDGLIKVKRMIG